MQCVYLALKRAPSALHSLFILPAGGAGAQGGVLPAAEVGPYVLLLLAARRDPRACLTMVAVFQRALSAANGIKSSRFRRANSSPARPHLRPAQSQSLSAAAGEQEQPRTSAPHLSPDLPAADVTPAAPRPMTPAPHGPTFPAG